MGAIKRFAEDVSVVVGKNGALDDRVLELASRVMGKASDAHKPFSSDNSKFVELVRAEVLVDLRDVECGLSPENLSCDGLLPRAAIKRKLRELTARRKELVAELGGEPSFKEVWEISG
jgi:hypothetical protein